MDLNLVNGVTSDAPKLKASDNVLYDYVDGLNAAQDAHSQASTLAHPDGSVKTPKIADGAVTTAKLADKSVTTAKIADAAVGVAQLSPGAQVNESVNNALIVALKADLALSPEAYTGTDYQKLQSALDDAITNNRAIRLSRIYDITGNTILINKAPDPDRTPLYIFGDNGGGIKKTDSGFIFSAPNPFTGDIFVESIRFISNNNAATIVYDGNKLTRLHSSNNTYRNCDGVAKSTNVLQSFRFNLDNIVGGNGIVIDAVNPYDIVIENCLIEKCKDFFKSTGAVDGANGVRIVNNCIEGLSGAAIYLTRTVHVTIEGNYFESNAGGHIVFAPTGEARYVNILNNVKVGAAESGISALIKWPATIGASISIGNRSFNIPVHDLSAITTGFVAALDSGGIGVTNGIGTDKFINNLLSTFTSDVTNGTVTDWGYMTRMYNTATTSSIAAGASVDVLVTMQRPVANDDHVSAKVFAGTANPIIVRNVYRASDGVHVVVKNDHSSSQSLTIQVTVIQLRHFN
jgi:hypothetical protein